MLNKIKQQLSFNHAGPTKKKGDSKSELQFLENLDNKDFEINLENLWQYNIEELCDFIRKYDKYSLKLKKKIVDIFEAESNFKLQTELLEKEKRKLLEEKEQSKMLLENIQLNLKAQLLDKEKLLLELDSNKKEKEKLKLENENLKKEFSKTEYGISITIASNNLSKIFKFIEPKNLKSLENKIEELSDFFNEHLKILNLETLEKLKYILKQLDNKEEEKDEGGLESNRSYNPEEYTENSNRDQFSGRESESNRESARNNINLNNLICEMYDQYQIMKDSIPVIEQTKLKINDLTNNFNLINETLQIYKTELKDIINEEIEKNKKEFVLIQKENEKLNENIKKYENELSSFPAIQSENNQMKITLNEMQKKFENELKTLLNQLTEENNNLKETNKKINEEYEELNKSYRKLEEDHKDENKKLLKEIDDVKISKENIERKMRGLDEIGLLKQKEFEKLLQIERNKLEQKSKEFLKLDDSYKDLKTVSSKQLEDFNRINDRFKQLEEKYNEEKKNINQLKTKHIENISNFEEEIKKLKKDLTEKEEKIKNYEEREKKLTEELTQKIEEKGNFSKEMYIQTQELKLNELNEQIAMLNLENTSLKSNMDLIITENKSNLDLISLMKEKRESALKEIRRLMTIIDTMKSKKPENHIDSSFIHNNNISIISTSTGKQGFDSNNFNKIMIEANFLNIIKKDIEGLYRDFMPLMPFDIDKLKQLPYIQFEKRMNDCIKKTQDMIDSIEDMG